VRQWLADAEQSPPKNFSSQMGWVRIALQNAFCRLLHAKTLEEGVVETVRSGGDTDTNGAIAGALLGAVHGAGAIPAQWKERVLTCRPMQGRLGVHRPRMKDFWPVDALVLAERLLWLGNHQEQP
jgi:ADP-ribosylglycohydrolase